MLLDGIKATIPRITIILTWICIIFTISDYSLKFKDYVCLKLAGPKTNAHHLLYFQN